MASAAPERTEVRESALDDDGVRWLALLIRQAFLLVVCGIERRYGLPSSRERGSR